MVMCCAYSYAQTGREAFKASYERQVRNVGSDGVGVETIISRWEKEYPDDPDMLIAKFGYNYAKSQHSEMIVRDSRKYLGQAPVLSLKDSLGNDVNYFEDSVFDEAVFSEGMKALDKAISIEPKELRYRFYKITALMGYEKESPDLAAGEIVSLIDSYRSSEGWMLDGEPVSEEIFCQGIGEYCAALFHIGSAGGYEYFLRISEKMNKLYPDNTVFINNIGSYWQVAAKNDKKALKYYRKVLKMSPDDYAANYNVRIIQSSQSKKGRSSK